MNIIAMMTVREVSAYLRVHPSTVYRLLKLNQIPAFRVGADWRFEIAAIYRWRKERQRVEYSRVDSVAAGRRS
jgi:excisionase family DNA binding protein